MNDFIPKTGPSGKAIPAGTETKKNSNVQKTGDGFDRILNRHTLEGLQTENAETVRTKTAATTLGEIQGPLKVPLNTPAADTLGMLRRLDDSLGLLEQYAAVLKDPGKNLKQAHKILEKLMEETQSLAGELKENPPEDSGMSKIMTELITAAAVEQVKFNRGDYSS